MMKILILFLLQFASPQTPPALQCNQRVMAKLQLNGFQPGEELQDSTICPNIKAQNNCCSSIDEIKIVKNWTQYTKPRMELY